MAHVVGVPRRDPCQKCQLPVFLAERLTVGKKVYHRTCLKCARCHSQLTPGNFYETEVDNEYCCETCPDEELMDADQLASGSGESALLRAHQDEEENASGTAPPRGGVRSSLADRLAVFEQAKAGAGEPSTSLADRKLLQKSVSDEEKSATLKRLEAGAGVAAYRGSAALSSFLSDTLDGDDTSTSEATNTASTQSKTATGPTQSDTDEDDEGEEEVRDERSVELQAPPALPATLPPRMESPGAADTLLRSGTSTPTPGKRFTATAQLQLSPSPSPERAITPEKKKAEIRLSLSNEAEGAATNRATTPTKTITDEAVAAPTMTITTTTNHDKVDANGNEEKAIPVEPPTRMEEKTKADPAGELEAVEEKNKAVLVLEPVAEKGGSAGVIKVEEVEEERKMQEQQNKADQENDDDKVVLSAINVNENCFTKDKIAVTHMEIDEEEEEKEAAPSIGISTVAVATTASTDTTTTMPPVAPSQPTPPGEQTVSVEAAVVPSESATTVRSRTKSPVELRTKSPRPQPTREDRETTERLSVVRARLQQFEVIAQRGDSGGELPPMQINHNQHNHNEKRSDKQQPDNEDAPLKERQSGGVEDSVAASLLPQEDTTEKPQTNTNEDKDLAREEKPLAMDIDLIEEKEEKNEEEEQKLEEKKEMEVPLQADEEQLPPADEVVPPKTESLIEVPSKDMPSDDKDLEAANLDKDGQTMEVITTTPPSSPITTTTTTTLTIPKAPSQEVVEMECAPEEQPIASVRRQSKEESPKPATIAEYPEDLNPFASDDDDEDEAEESRHAVVQLRNNNNNKENISPRPHTLNTLNSGRSSTATTMSNDSARNNKAKSVLNPFDSSDDEIELDKSTASNVSTATTPSSSSKVPPPRPPPPRISRNPFGDVEDEPEGGGGGEPAANLSRRSSATSSLNKRTPVPTPRTNVSQSATPEPTPRLSTRTPQSGGNAPLQNTLDCYGSAHSLASGGGGHLAAPGSHGALQRNSDLRGSNNSLTSSAGGTMRSRKSRKAPAPPMPPSAPPTVRELFPPDDTNTSSSKTSTPSSSTVVTPKMGRKKRLAPAPPKPARLEAASQLPHITIAAVPKNSLDYPLQIADLESQHLSDEEKVLLEGKQQLAGTPTPTIASSQRSSLRLIPLDASLLAALEDETSTATTACSSDDVKRRQQRRHDGLPAEEGEEETNVIYRRSIVPLAHDTPTRETNPLLEALGGTTTTHDRQLEKLKDNKEAQNRNRQSQISGGSGGSGSGGGLVDNEEGDHLGAFYNKSAHGKWKRRKGPAPALPVPARKVLLMLPLQEIRHELDIIEVQQQGLEKQGVILEKMIRDRCEGDNGQPIGQLTVALDAVDDAAAAAPKSPVVGEGGDSSGEEKSLKTPVVAKAEHVQNSKEVEDLILQLFELVNEKNELFRRQAELMYLRRQHRLEQEQADLEYEIRVLMAQPECNKTDSDKSREEGLIARLVEVVQLRNEVVECLEMDRLREAEEDLSIKQRLESHTAKRDDTLDSQKGKSSNKLSKKEKKKQKEAKKVSKSKKIDADKDADETELNDDKQRTKMKKKKKFLF